MHSHGDRNGRPIRTPGGVACNAVTLGACIAATFVVTAHPGNAQVVDPTFACTNGDVVATMAMGDTIVIGGVFTWVGPANGTAVALDQTTGLPVPDWPIVGYRASAPGPLPGCAVVTLPDGTGGCFLGGSFVQVSGIPRYGLSHIRGDGTLDAWAPVPDASVGHMLQLGRTLYLAGAFTTLSGQPRAGLGAVDIVTGQVTAWNPGLGSAGHVAAMVTDGSLIYVGGDFTAIGGQARARVAALDPTTGAATTLNPGADQSVYALALEDSLLYLGGNFTSVGGQPRQGLAAVNTRTGSLTAFAPIANGTINGLALCGDTLCVAGGFSTLGGRAHKGLGAVSASTGLVLPWAMDIDDPLGSLTLATDASRLYLGGRFTSISGTHRSCLAAFDRGTLTMSPWNPGASGYVTGIGTYGDRVFVSGGITGCGGLDCQNLAAVDDRTGKPVPWAPKLDRAVMCLAQTDAVIVAGGNFTTVDGIPRPALAQFDRASGRLTPWAVPSFAGETVGLCSRLGSTLYVGRTVPTSFGVQAYGPRALDLVSGQFLPWSPNLADVFTGMEAGGDRVFFLGFFTAIDGQARRCLAAVDAVTGAVLPWNPQITGWPSSMTLRDSTLYVSGATSVAGQTVSGVVGLDTATASVRAWHPSLPMWAIAMCATDSALYVGSDNTASWPGSDARTATCALARFSDTVLPWQPYVSGGSSQFGNVQHVTARGHEVFLSGTFQYAGGLYRNGFTRVLPADTGPPVVGLLAPGGGEVLTVGSARTVRWIAQDDLGVASADVYLSRSGPTGPWELLAAGITGTDAWTWTIAGPPAAGSCWLRVVARDWAGNSAAAVSAGAFSIVDGTTPTLVELFRVTATTEGMQLEWKLSADGAASVTVERGASPSGGWSEVHGAVRVQGGLSSMLDGEARPAGSTWYRLALAMPSGGLVHTPPIEAGGLLSVTEFALGAPAPNPATNGAVFSYALPRSGPLRLGVLDIQGRERSVLANGAHEPGVFTAALDSRSLQPGLYFIRLQARGVEIRRRVVVIH